MCRVRLFAFWAKLVQAWLLRLLGHVDCMKALVYRYLTGRSRSVIAKAIACGVPMLIESRNVMPQEQALRLLRTIPLDQASKETRMLCFLATATRKPVAGRSVLKPAASHPCCVFSLCWTTSLAPVLAWSCRQGLCVAVPSRECPSQSTSRWEDLENLPAEPWRHGISC